MNNMNSSNNHNSLSERIPMLACNDVSTSTQAAASKNENFYDMRPLSTKLSSSSGGTNGIIINNYSINNKNGFMTRICCHVMKGVQRNIQKCVAVLVLISFFSIIFFTQYMDSSSPLVG